MLTFVSQSREFDTFEINIPSNRIMKKNGIID